MEGQEPTQERLDAALSRAKLAKQRGRKAAADAARSPERREMYHQQQAWHEQAIELHEQAVAMQRAHLEEEEARNRTVGA